MVEVRIKEKPERPRGDDHVRQVNKPSNFFKRRWDDLIRAEDWMTEKSGIGSFVDNIKDFNLNNLDPVQAAGEMIRTNITISEVKRLQRFFSGNPREYVKIRQAVITDLLGSIKDDIFTTPAKSRALLDAMNQYRPGVLKQIIGKNHYRNLEQFAKDLTFLGDVGKEGSIYAATFAAHPIAKLPANVRMKGMARLFASPTALNFFA